VSSILAFRREALPTLQYFPNDTELALGMTLLELHLILQSFCVRQEDGGGVNRGSLRHRGVDRTNLSDLRFRQSCPDNFVQRF